MTVKLPHRTIKQAVAARMATDEATAALRYFQAVPPDADFPYVCFLGLSGRTLLTSTTGGIDAGLTLKVCTRSAKGAASSAQLSAMMEAVAEAMTRAPLDLGEEHAAVLLDLEAADELPPYDDDAFTYMEGYLRFRLITQQIGDESSSATGESVPEVE